MKKILGIAIAALMLVSVTASSAFAADGKSLYKSKRCAMCHGPTGNGGAGPKISGKDQAFIVEQFTAIQDGTRTTGKSKMMTRMVKSVSAADAGAIATYLSSL